MTRSKAVLIDDNPGRNCQTFGIARTQRYQSDPRAVGGRGRQQRRLPQCYIGVSQKVDTIHDALRARIGTAEDKLSMRLVQPEFTVALRWHSQRHQGNALFLDRPRSHQRPLCEHLSATGLEGVIAVVACDKPPVGTLAALLEHNRPAIIMSDGSIRPGAARSPANHRPGYQLSIGRQRRRRPQAPDRPPDPARWQLRRHVHL